VAHKVSKNVLTISPNPRHRRIVLEIGTFIMGVWVNVAIQNYDFFFLLPSLCRNTIYLGQGFVVKEHLSMFAPPEGCSWEHMTTKGAKENC